MFMKKPTVGSPRLLAGFTAAGYLAGILLYFAGFFGFEAMTPVLPAAAGIRPLLDCLQSQAAFFLAVWLCGLIRLPFPLCAPILFYRSALAGAAACSIYRSDLPVWLYFAHTAFSALILVLLLSLGSASWRFSAGGTGFNRDRLASYALTFLFLTGTAVLLLLIFQFLLIFAV